MQQWNDRRQQYLTVKHCSLFTLLNKIIAKHSIFNHETPHSPLLINNQFKDQNNTQSYSKGSPQYPAGDHNSSFKCLAADKVPLFTDAPPTPRDLPEDTPRSPVDSPGTPVDTPPSHRWIQLLTATIVSWTLSLRSLYNRGSYFGFIFEIGIGFGVVSFVFVLIEFQRLSCHV